MTRVPRPYASGAWSGIGLGGVLLLSFVVAGRGLGASGAFAATAGRALEVMPGSPTFGDAALADRIPLGVALAGDWIVLEVLGIFLGGAAAAWFGGRWRRQGTPTPAPRLVRALMGGALMGVGARVAYGCTSGLALSGGALMSTGAWLFIPIAFGTAIVVAGLVRAPSGEAGS